MIKIKLKNLPYFSMRRFKLEGLTGPFESCVWSGVSHYPFDSQVIHGTYKMEVRCISGPMQGAKFWLDWETEVLWLDSTEKSNNHLTNTET